MDNSPNSNLTLHNNISTPSTGITLGTSDNTSSVTIEFVPSVGCTFTANFEWQGLGGVWKSASAINTTTLTMGTSATDSNYFYQISTIGVIAVRVNITAITGGTLTVFGLARG